MNESDPSGYDPQEALAEVHKNRADIIAISRANHIQPQLLGGVVFAEVNAGGLMGYHYMRRKFVSIPAFALRGRGDVGVTKFHQLRSDHPELKTFAQRIAWATKRDADDHLGLVEAASYLGHLARRRWGKKAISLTPAQMAITISEYNLGERPLSGKHYPNKEGIAFLLGIGIDPETDIIDTGLFGEEDEVSDLRFRLNR